MLGNGFNSDRQLLADSLVSGVFLFWFSEGVQLSRAWLEAELFVSMAGTDSDSYKHKST